MKKYWGTTAFIPVYDCTSNSALSPVPVGTDACNSGNGHNLKYHIMGYAPFYVTGWSLSGENQKNVHTNADTVCTGPGNSGRCLTGWFTSGLIPHTPVDNTGVSTDPMLGGMAVQAAG